MNRRRRRRRRHGAAGDPAWRNLWETLRDNARGVFGGLIIFIVAAGAISLAVAQQRISADRELDEATLCSVRHPVPEAVLVLVDATDPLGRDNQPRFRTLMLDYRDKLPRGGRLIVAKFDGDLGKPITAVFDICNPGKGSDAHQLDEGPIDLQDRYDEKFNAPLNSAIATLSGANTSPTSPIAEQIARAAIDPALHWNGLRRRLVVLTDGLQNTANSPVYQTHTIVLPPPRMKFLRGVRVSYVELANERDQALQTPEVRQTWTDWLTDAGGTVETYAEGYARP